MAKRTAHLFFIILLLAIAVAPGCNKLKRRGQDPFKNMRAVRRQTLTKIVPASDVSSIYVNEPRGAITINFEPVEEITVQAVKVVKSPGKDQASKMIGEFTVETQLKKSRLEVSTKYPDGFADKYDARTRYKITAPGGLAVSITTKTGAVAVTSGAGDVTITTQSGPAAVSDASGKVEISSESGDLRVLHCYHGAEIKTRSGHIEFRTEVPPAMGTRLISESGLIDVVIPESSDLTVTADAPNRDNAIAGFTELAVDGVLTLGSGTFKLDASAPGGAVYVIPFRDDD